MKTLKNMFIACMVFSSLALFGQTENSLAIQEDGTFQIPSTNLKEVYSIDISSLELNSIEEAVEFFSEKNTNLIMFRPNADGTTATVFLQINRKPEWSVSDWNNTISDINLLEQ
ncbi:hypothetical protein O3Q51_17330 [Cryomorphaceae bacterium 1068]|nr:hypothetical protein [Cryomorphaceae bacterium 1068]